MTLSQRPQLAAILVWTVFRAAIPGWAVAPSFALNAGQIEKRGENNVCKTGVGRLS